MDIIYPDSMPCTDVTEILSLTLDHEDRVIHYSLLKMTCGGSVGNPSLLRKWIENRTATEVLAATPEEVLTALPTISTTWEFLTLKHLFAVQIGLEALLGLKPSGPEAICAVDTVEHLPQGVRLIAQIKVDVLSDKIAACKGCGCQTIIQNQSLDID